MNGYKWVVVAWFALAAIVRIGYIDRERPKISHGDAIRNVIVFAALAACVVAS